MQSGRLKHYGKEYKFTKYQNRAEEKARKIVSYLKAEMNRIGNDKTASKKSPVDNGILTGGGAIYFEMVLEKLLDGKFYVLPDPIMGNVRGFFEYDQNLINQI